MSLFANLRKLASDRDVPPEAERDPMHALCVKFSFLPAPDKIVIPAGWFTVMKSACRRLGAVVPPTQWGRSFQVTSFSVRDGALEIATVGGNASVKAVLAKVRRSSMSICSECGTPGIPFPGKLGLTPHCPKCLQTPALLRDLEDVLGWRAGIEGPTGMGIRVNRIPRTLRASFRQWLEASGLDVEEIQPWDLEVWLRDLARAQKALRRGYS